MTRALAILFPAFATPLGAETALPTGLKVTPLDEAVELQPDGEAWLVLRYLAPALADQALSYEDVLPDLDHLCVNDGLPRLAAADQGQGIAQIVVILLDRPVPRGTPDPAARQFIGAYLPSDEGCEWQ